MHPNKNKYYINKKQKNTIMKNIKIAPDLEEITRKNNVFSCEFNNTNIRWCIAYDCTNLLEENEIKLKKWLQNAIALSSQSWQISYFLNNNGLPFSSDIFINGDRVENNF